MASSLWLFLLIADPARASQAVRAALPLLVAGPAAPIAATLSKLPPARLEHLFAAHALPAGADPEAVEQALLARRAALDDQANEFVRLAYTGPAGVAPERVARAYDLLIDGYPFLSEENRDALLQALPALLKKRALYERAVQTRLWSESVARRLLDAPAAAPQAPAEDSGDMPGRALTPAEERLEFLNTIWARIREISWVIVPHMPKDPSLTPQARAQRISRYAEMARRIKALDEKRLDPAELRLIAEMADDVAVWHDDYVHELDRDYEFKESLKRGARELPALLRDLASQIEGGRA